MVAGPEVSHLVSLYEIEEQTKVTCEYTVHHEQTFHAQKTFLENVKKLSMVLQDMGSPFQEEGHDLYPIINGDIANSSSAELPQSHTKKGKKKKKKKSKSLLSNCKTIQPLSMGQSS